MTPDLTFDFVRQGETGGPEADELALVICAAFEREASLGYGTYHPIRTILEELCI